jgi:hypothetical protein
MTQPSFVPVAEADQVRAARHLQVPGHWVAERPAELAIPRLQSGRGVGRPGPDQGFALLLGHRFEDKLRLTPGESVEDAVVGCALVASRRAGLFGRAPCVYDLTVAFSLWGFLQDVPAELVAERVRLFRSAAHDYVVQLEIADRVEEETLALSPEQVADWLAAGGWRQLLPPVQAVAPG